MKAMSYRSASLQTCPKHEVRTHLQGITMRAWVWQDCEIMNGIFHCVIRLLCGTAMNDCIKHS